MSFFLHWHYSCRLDFISSFGRVHVWAKGRLNIYKYRNIFISHHLSVQAPCLITMHGFICILQVLVFNNLSLMCIDLLSPGPRLGLLSEVWSTSIAPPPAPTLFQLILKCTDHCHHNDAVFTFLGKLLNSFHLLRCVFALFSNTQHASLFI